MAKNIIELTEEKIGSLQDKITIAKARIKTHKRAKNPGMVKIEEHRIISWQDEIAEDKAKLRELKAEAKKAAKIAKKEAKKANPDSNLKRVGKVALWGLALGTTGLLATLAVQRYGGSDEIGEDDGVDSIAM
jgi:hypothetical protein